MARKQAVASSGDNDGDVPNGGDEELETESEEPPDFELEFHDILGGQTQFDEFVRGQWERGQIYSTSLSPDVLDQLMEGFYDGDAEKILEACRNDHNARIGPEDPGDSGSSMEDLQSGGKTLNLPFCFCPSALALRESFVAALGEHANDVECGVYLSRPGGDSAEWHLDNNHNFTIQLTGQKDWYVIEGGDPSPVASAALLAGHERPRNRTEQQRAVPSAGVAKCFNLAPGSVIYVPPGCWHRVVPVSGDSLSADIRAAHIHRATWMAESLFATALAHLHGSRAPAQSPGHSTATSPGELAEATEPKLDGLAGQGGCASGPTDASMSAAALPAS
jgi:hypothetical protein